MADSHELAQIMEIIDTIRSWSNNCPPSREIMQRLDKIIFDLFNLLPPQRELILDFFEYKYDFLRLGMRSKATDQTQKPIVTQGTINDIDYDDQYLTHIEAYLHTFLDTWNRELEPNGELKWRIIKPPNIPMLATIFTTMEKGDKVIIDKLEEEKDEWNEILKRCEKGLLLPISERVYIDGIVRVVTDTEIIIIKRDERRLWTRSAAREDVEAQSCRLFACKKTNRSSLMSQPRISKLDSWTRHEIKVINVLETALRLLRNKHELKRSERYLNRELFFCLLEANRLMQRNNMDYFDSLPVFEGVNAPLSDDCADDVREKKYQIFNGVIVIIFLLIHETVHDFLSLNVRDLAYLILGDGY